MKKRTIIPMALSAALLFGCASSNESMNDASASGDMTMSETQTMAGSASEEEEKIVITEEAVIPIATLSSTTLTLENTVDVSEMFNDISDTKQYDMLALARKTPNLSTFVTLVEKADMVDDFQRVGEMTLFAPTNAAFAKIDKQELEKLVMPENKAQLMKILQAHVIPSKVSSAAFKDNQRIRLTEDTYLPVSIGMSGSSITVGGATVVKNNIETSNGYIHVVDSVIMPSKDSVEKGLGY